MMDIRPITEGDLEAVQALLVSGGWEERAADLQRFAELVARSQVAHVALVDGRIVGFVRGLTDGISNGYISMLVVHHDHRKRGIGSSLVKACMGDNLDLTWVLRAGRPGLAHFYEKLGFQQSQVAMERPRRPARGA
jgi:ribosomal protein S18 acetylase RimI-like enzyme